MNSNQTSIDLALKKYDVITELIKDKITKLEAIEKLDISDNYIYPLINKYEPGNSICYLNKKIGIPINVKVTNELEKEICQKFITYCKTLKNKPVVVVGRPSEWFQRPTYNLFYDTYKTEFTIGKTRVIEILKANQLFSSRCRLKKVDSIKPSVETIREKRSGFEVQLDGKVNIKFPNDDFTCVAHIAVDAGTNTFLGAVFDKQETTQGYIDLLRITMLEHGVAKNYVTDCRSSFTTNRECGDKNVVIASALNEGLSGMTNLITSSNAKRKNKVESKNDVFQLRVLSMLSLLGVTTMHEAQSVIAAVLKKVNEDLKNPISKDNFFTEFPQNVDFEMVFAQKFERSVHKYSQIQIQNLKYFAITNDNQILYMKKKVKVSTYIKANQQIQVKYRGKLYDCIIADEKAKKKYSYKIEKKRTTIYRQERYNLWINDKFYHLVDNDNNVVKIEINDSVCKVYDESSKLLYVTKNGHPYAHVKGKAKVDPVSEHIVIDYKTSVINYDSSIKLNNNTYFLKGQGKQVVFPVGQKVEVVVENGYPTYIRHEKMLITLHEKDIIDIRLLLPKSKHCTHKTFCADNTELNIME